MRKRQQLSQEAGISAVFFICRAEISNFYLYSPRIYTPDSSSFFGLFLFVKQL